MKKMNRDKQRTDSNKMFHGLVLNALDFLQRSVGELQASPKYSVIDFCTAIELFLKARLLAEHWVLICENPDEKKLTSTNFRQGEFKSVGMDAAIERLKKLLDSRITDEAQKVFERIRQHRNKLMHFFHKAYADKPDRTAIEDVVAEQCRGWYYLYPLLTKTWGSYFAPYLSEIEKIQSLMLQNRAFLGVRFEARSQDIEKGKAKGAVFLACPFCGFEAMRITVIAGQMFSAECLVCEEQLQGLLIQCFGCSNKVFVPARSTEIFCDKCSTKISFEDIVNLYAPHPDSGEDAVQKNRAVCGQCCPGMDRESAVLFDDKWVCLSCFNVEKQVWRCERCGLFITGEDESPLSICLSCESVLEDEEDWEPPPGHVM